MNLPDRIMRYVSPEPNSGCWLWTGSVDKDGYGKVLYRTKHLRAHRLMYQALRGEIPEGLVLDHLCRVPCCVNPDHLEPVTWRENTKRGLGWCGDRSACPAGHEYDAANTLHYRGYRYCRKCHATREAARRRIIATAA